MEKSKVHKSAQRYFQIISFVFLASILGYFLLPFLDATTDLGKHLPFVNNSVVKVTLVWLLCLYIAGDIRKRKGLILVFILGHVLSILSMLLYVLIIKSTTVFDFGFFEIDESKFLLYSIIVDIAVTLPAIIFYFKLPKSSDDKSNTYIGPLRGLTLFLAILFTLAAIGYHIGPYMQNTSDFFISLPMVSNSVVKVGIMAMICYYVYTNIHRNISAFNIAIVAHVVSILIQMIYAFTGKNQGIMDLGFISLSEIQVLWAAVGLDLVISFFMIKAYLKYWKVTYNNPKFLRPVEYRSLVGLSEVIVQGGGEDEVIQPVQIAANLDRYVFTHDC